MKGWLFDKIHLILAIFTSTIATASTIHASAIWIITFLSVCWSSATQLKF
jgi:hypothetical protein